MGLLLVPWSMVCLPQDSSPDLTMLHGLVGGIEPAGIIAWKTIYNCGSESESVDMFAQTHITFSGTNMKTVASTSPQQRPAKTVFLHLFGLRGGRDPWMACRFPSHQSTRIYSTKKKQSCYPPVIKHGNFG